MTPLSYHSSNLLLTALETMRLQILVIPTTCSVNMRQVSRLLFISMYIVLMYIVYCFELNE